MNNLARSAAAILRTDRELSADFRERAAQMIEGLGTDGDKIQSGLCTVAEAIDRLALEIAQRGKNKICRVCQGQGGSTAGSGSTRWIPYSACGGRGY